MIYLIAYVIIGLLTCYWLGRSRIFAGDRHADMMAAITVSLWPVILIVCGGLWAYHLGESKNARR